MKVDLGEKPEKCQPCDAPVAANQAKNDIWYPCFYLSNSNGENAPDIGELKGGQELQATVRVKTITRNEDKDGKIRYSYDFEVLSLDVPEGKQSKKAQKEKDEEAVEKGIDEAMSKKKGEDYD